ncbi:MAG: endonuclease Q family protein [Patescibacteria group bacterium]
MRIITDLHIHSKWSRACSKDLTLPGIAVGCERKGVNLIGTGDAFHPAWQKDIRTLLVEEGDGIFRLSEGGSPTRFLLSTEISSIYKRNDKVRRVHNVILFPSLEALERMTASLQARDCNLSSDGRPIVGIDSEELLRMVLDADPSCLLIPAHAWTPWFSVFGSKSGFDSLEECFGEMTPHVHAIETGLSSDPRMNRRCSMLDGVMLVSNSDAHSPAKIGRESNVFEMGSMSYREMRRILVERDTSSFIETLEFFPEEGKYHADGHRDCSFWCTPEETRRMKGSCPQCGRPLTVGVTHRVSDVCDRDDDARVMEGHVPFRSVVPLSEIIASVYGVSPTSKRVEREAERIVSEIGNEFHILLDAPVSEIASNATDDIAQAILAVRRGEVEIRPGYDGEFGSIKPKIKRASVTQGALFH